MAHTFDNLHNGDEPVRAITIMTPGGHFDMFENMGQVPAGPGQAAQLRRVAEQHGTEIVGPPLRVLLGIE